MAEKQERNPSIDFRDIPLGEGSFKIKLDGSKEIATGESTYGTWFLWAGFVTDVPAYEGKGKDRKSIGKYTGKVVFFPTNSLHEQLIKLANGNEQVEVVVKKMVEETKKGIMRKYVAEKVSDGRPAQSSISPTEMKLLNDAQALIRKGHKIDLQTFIMASKDDIYEGKITEERAKILYTMFQ